MASRTWPNNRPQDRHKPNTSFLIVVVESDDELHRPSAADFDMPEIVDCSIGVGASTAGCVVGVDCNEPAWASRRKDIVAIVCP